MLTVSVIATVYNEGESLRRLLDSLVVQTRPPDEVVICDGGSTDETVAVLESYRDRLPGLRVSVEPGANISRGRNCAISAARGPIIAVTDAGVCLDAIWLEKLVEPWEGKGQRTKAESGGPQSPIASAGFFLPDAHGIFQTAMAATVLPLVEDVDPARFLPSSRSVAFHKEAWAAVGGYPEWLDYCEDLIFDLRMNAQFAQGQTAFVWTPEAVARFQPRTSWRGFGMQYYRYARGDGKADLWRKRHALRYVIYFVFLPALIGHALMGIFRPPIGLAGFAGRHDRLLCAALATVGPTAHACQKATAGGCRTGSADPGCGRRGKDGRLSGGPALALAASTSRGNPLALS